MMILRFLIALLFLPSIAIAQMSHPPGGGGGCNTSGSQILKGDGAGGCDNATAGTDFTSPSSTETMTNKTLAAANNVIEADTGDSATSFFSGGTIEAARLPNLNTVATGLTASRCVETDGSSLLTVAAGACGTGGGYTTIDDEDTPLTQRSTLNFEGAGVVCADDVDQTTCTIGTGAGGDSITVDGAAVVDPDFDDGGDIDFTNTSNVITATVKADSVALGTDTTGNYAGSSSEGGAATSATALAANGGNCSAGSFPLGVDASGAAENCTAAIVKAQSFQKCTVIKGATTADDYPLEKFPGAITITDIHVYAIGGTNVVGGLDECTGTAGVCSSVTAVDADITGTAGSNVEDDGALTNGGIAAGNWIQWHTTSVSGTNTSLSICFNYTID